MDISAKEQEGMMERVTRRIAWPGGRRPLKAGTRPKTPQAEPEPPLFWLDEVGECFSLEAFQRVSARLKRQGVITVTSTP